MSKFSVGDRVVYVGGSKLSMRSENVGLVGTVIGEGSSDDTIRVKFDEPNPWENWQGVFSAYPSNLQKLNDEADADTLAP